MNGQIVQRARIAAVNAHTVRQNMCHNLRNRVVSRKQTAYRHRLTGDLVQQGLSVAGDVRECTQFGSATDKRYSLYLLSTIYQKKGE